jgi:hypothetical protein
MEYIDLQVGRFAKKHDLVPKSVRTFIRQYFGKAAEESRVRLSRNEYRMLRDYFTEEGEMIAYVFYNPGRDRSRLFKNVIKLVRQSSMPARDTSPVRLPSAHAGGGSRSASASMPAHDTSPVRSPSAYAGGGGRYRYEWYRYMITNGTLTRIKLCEIDVGELEKQRVWRSPIDRTVLVLNESGQFEAMFRLSERHPTKLECV